MSYVYTVVIFETTDETVLYLKDGDLRKFEGVIVNSTETELEYELAHIDFNPETNAITTEQARQYIADGAFLVHCGFIY